MLVVALVILLIVSNASGKGLYSPSLLIEGIKHKFTTKIGGEAVFCYTGTGNTTEPSYLFNEVLIHVNETNGKKIPWYSVKGVSTDDLHMHLENMVYYIMEQAGFQTDHEIKAPYEVESYIRDAVSACPNPLFSSSRSECVMRFSSVGQACVRITSAQEAKELLHFVVYVEEKLNMNFVYRFLFGATAFFIAGRLGYNMLFQYLAGAMVFICGGALAVFLLALKYVARARSGRTQWLRNLLVALLLSGVYLTSALWFLRQHWHDLVLRYWEYVLGYVAVSGILGVVAVQMQRNDAKDRHRLAVIVKWIIRAVGVTLLYNSTASPFGSLTLVGLTVLLYLTYALYKPHSVVPIGMHDTDGAAASKKEQ